MTMIGNRYAIELVRLLQNKRIPTESILEGTGVDWARLQNGEQIIRKPQMLRLTDNALSLSGEPDLGLQFGMRLNANTHGILGYALMSCATLHEAVKVLLKYFPLVLSPGTSLDFHVEGDSAVLTIEMAQDPAVKPAQRLFTIESVFASVYITAAFLLNEELSDSELWLDYPRPLHADSYATAFPLNISFDKSSCQLRSPRSLLDRALNSANPAAARIYQQQCNSILNNLRQRDGVARQVQQLLLQHNGEFPRIKAVARHLNMSERTLRRRLSAEETSFQEVLNDVRYRIACEYLEGTQLGIADIAELLGFADPSNFRRAFVQWANISPAEFRKGSVSN